MKAKMHNNFDGYMYVRHDLSLGEITYKGTINSVILGNKQEGGM